MLSTSVHKTQRHSQHYLRKKKKVSMHCAAGVWQFWKNINPHKNSLIKPLFIRGVGLGWKKKKKNEEKSYHAKIQNLFEDHTKIAVVTIYRKELDWSLTKK